MENLTGYDYMAFEFAQCTFNLLDRFVNFPRLLFSLCAPREITVFVLLHQHMKYTLQEQKLKKIINRHFCLTFSLSYMFISSCKLFIIETRAYDIAHDENANSSSIIQSV